MLRLKFEKLNNFKAHTKLEEILGIKYSLNNSVQFKLTSEASSNLPNSSLSSSTILRGDKVVDIFV